MDNYSFSTAWNCTQFESGEEIVADIKALGFNSIELNFQFTSEKLQGIYECVRTGTMTVSSIHNYCPIPDDVPVTEANPDRPSLASNQEQERRRAVAYTQRTIETAARLGAPVVITHSGKVAIEERTRRLISLYQRGGYTAKEFQQLRAEAIDDRREHVKEHFDALCTSYAELVPFAREKQVKIGIENRFYYYELPSADELAQLLKYFSDKTLGYWHDIGHAWALETLGFYPKHYWLESLRKKMIGIHLHDIIGLKDHATPFTGEFDWSVLRRYNLAHVIKVLEVHAYNLRDDIPKSVERLEREIFTRT